MAFSHCHHFKIFTVKERALSRIKKELSVRLQHRCALSSTSLAIIRRRVPSLNFISAAVCASVSAAVPLPAIAKTNKLRKPAAGLHSDQPSAKAATVKTGATARQPVIDSSRPTKTAETLQQPVSETAIQQPNATTTGKATFGDFISTLDCTPSFTKNDAPTSTASRSEGKQPTIDIAADNFVGLFSTNRRLTEEKKLRKFAVDDSPLTLEPNDMLDVRSKLGFCLVGYTAGKFPGLKAIRALSQTWGSSFQQHESGWLIFHFARKEDRKQILSGGPYFIYRRPLLLKHMLYCFEFKEDDISLIPVWATLPSLPLECWHPNALGMIGSRIGNPIAMDSLMMKMEKVSYARILVEVDGSKKFVDQVEFVMPNGITRKQPVVYEFTTKFCTECNRFGHLQETCQGTHPPAVVAAAAPATAPVKQTEANKSQTTEWTTIQGGRRANLQI
ncbi:UNVERIFIED_CONTAM: hypothetical protein Sindi_2879200 [Sesamum indicum]